MTATLRTLEDLRALIAARREALGLSQDDLDRAVGLRRGTIKRFEGTGHYLASINLEAVLRALRIGLAMRLRPGHGGRLAA